MSRASTVLHARTKKGIHRRHSQITVSAFEDTAVCIPSAAHCVQELRFSSPPEPLDLRERWMDAKHMGGGGDVEDAEDVINMEEDMALR